MDMLRGYDRSRWKSEPVIDPDGPTIARAKQEARELTQSADAFGRFVTVVGFVIAFGALVGAQYFWSQEQHHFPESARDYSTALLVAFRGIALGLIVALLGRILTWVKTSALLAGLAAIQTDQTSP